MDDVHADIAERLRKLVSGHGNFRMCQLFELAEQRLGRSLTAADKQALREEATRLGAFKQKWDGLVHKHDPELYRFPVKRKQGLPGRKKDKLTIDMFFGKSARSVADERRRVVG